MSVPNLALLRWQFDLTWSLFEYHLERLDYADFLWEPADHCWSVGQSTDGTWTPQGADTEPDPVPVPTIGWLTWHVGWWWTVAMDHLRGGSARAAHGRCLAGRGRAECRLAAWTAHRMAGSARPSSATATATATATSTASRRSPGRTGPTTPSRTRSVGSTPN